MHAAIGNVISQQPVIFSVLHVTYAYNVLNPSNEHAPYVERPLTQGTTYISMQHALLSAD